MHELRFLINDTNSSKQVGFPQESFSILQAAKTQIQNLPTAKKLAKVGRSLAKERERKTYDDHLSSLQVQSKLAGSLTLEADEPLWKRIMWGLPPGQLSFILRAASDTLPTPMNMARWRIQIDSKCPLCGYLRSTTQHILNGCQTALLQGRYTWQHDSVLHELVSTLQRNVPEGSMVYADLDGFRASSNPPATIPPELCLTPCGPGIVGIGRGKATLLELTICGDSPHAMEQALSRKGGRGDYLAISSQLQAIGLKTTYHPVEVTSLGHSNAATLLALKEVCQTSDTSPAISRTIKQLMTHCARIAISCSQIIFYARKNNSWESRPLFKLYINNSLLLLFAL